VLVQTLSPDARAIRFAAGHDSDGFLEGELRHRHALRYPPFASLIRIVCSARDEQDAVGVADLLREKIIPPDADVLGPAPLFALRGRARSQLVVKARDRAAAIATVGAAVDELARTAGRRSVNVSVDVDPR
jgi:primosomal protein N' (replication factor Y)